VTEFSAPQAEGLKQSRELDLLRLRALERTNSGDWPIRKRGYHRALARGEEWAVRLSKLPPFAWWFQWFYRIPKEPVYRENPLLSLFKKDESWTGARLFAPLKFGSGG
jgi:hypothetical protein